MAKRQSGRVTLCAGQCPSGRVDERVLPSYMCALYPGFQPTVLAGKSTACIFHCGHNLYNRAVIILDTQGSRDVVCVCIRVLVYVCVCVGLQGQKSEQSLNAHSLCSHINLDPPLLHHPSKTQREKNWSGTYFIHFICNVSKHAIITRTISN